MVSYLANTIRTQIELSQRLATAKLDDGKEGGEKKDGEGADDKKTDGQRGQRGQGGKRGGRGGGAGGRGGFREQKEPREPKEAAE